MHESIFRIVKRIGVIQRYPLGSKMEINIVSWNGEQPKYDIRIWDIDHEHMRHGVTFTEEQARKLALLLNNSLLSGDLEQKGE